MNEPANDVVVIGGGIVGLATAYALSQRTDCRILVLEAEDRVAAHQTGHNSGVIHSGLYYKPGSLKAKNCTEGREMMYRFCAEHDIPHERCGKLVVATDKKELPALEMLQQRGTENGLKDIRRVGPEEMKEIEPHVTGIAGLVIQETGIVDYVAVSKKLVELINRRDATLRLNSPVQKIHIRGSQIVLETPQGEVHTRYLIACAGLQADRIAQMAGLRPDVSIVPFRGEYYDIVPERCFLVRNLIYPVPDPALPFLGVHFTRRITGGVEAGPNAVPAFKRHGYHRTSFSLKDTGEMLTSPGYWRLGLNFWKTGLNELYRSASKTAFLRDLQRLVPELRKEDIVPGGSGVRAQAVEHSGKLVDDFRIVSGERMIHVLNAPSPAATAALSIGETIANKAVNQFEIERSSPTSP